MIMDIKFLATMTGVYLISVNVNFILEYIAKYNLPADLKYINEVEQCENLAIEYQVLNFPETFFHSSWVLLDSCANAMDISFPSGFKVREHLSTHSTGKQERFAFLQNNPIYVSYFNSIRNNVSINHSSTYKKNYLTYFLFALLSFTNLIYSWLLENETKKVSFYYLLWNDSQILSILFITS